MAGIAPACGDSTEEKLAAAKLAQKCSIDSDCEGDLVCTFGHCHVKCTSDKDCKDIPGGSRCVRGPSGTGVCQNTNEKSCSGTGACVIPGQVCAADQQCRDVCPSRPCFTDQVCTTTGECASKSEVDSQNKLRFDAGGTIDAGSDASAGTGGTGGGGSGGTGGTSAATDAGGTSGTGGGADSGGAAGADSSLPSSDSGSDADANALDAGPGVILENEPNDTRDTPMPVPPTVTVQAKFEKNTDADYYEFIAPNDSAGGYFVFTITDIPGGQMFVTVVSTVNHGTVFGTVNTAQTGKALHGYWAVGPRPTSDAGIDTGRFHLIMQPKGTSVYPYNYKLTVRYFAANDAREPDTTLQTARDLDLDETAHALLFSGFIGDTVGSYDDWYKVELQAGAYTARLTDVPASANTNVQLWDSGGQITGKSNADRGFPVTLSGKVGAAGTYYFRVTNYNAAPTRDTTPLPFEIPEHFTNPYSFTVTQTD
jgi:hypothetical protein